MKITQHQLLQSLSAVLLTSFLAACNSADAPLAVSEEFTQFTQELAISAARPDPCTDQFVFQRELNGDPNDTFTGILDSGVVQEEHWYADTRTIIFFSYSTSDTWCNVWNESGVSWNR